MGPFWGMTPLLKGHGDSTLHFQEEDLGQCVSLFRTRTKIPKSLAAGVTKQPKQRGTEPQHTSTDTNEICPPLLGGIICAAHHRAPGECPDGWRS